LKKLEENAFDNYPFLSLVAYGGEEYVGIVQNLDDSVLSLYVFARLKDEQKARFLELGEVWWWESNRTIPINLFLKKDFQEFQTCLVTFNRKDCEIRTGPSTSICDLAKKRSKRRNIQLVKKVK